MDIQNVESINHQICVLVKKYDIPVSEELLLVVDNCTEKVNTTNQRTGQMYKFPS